MGKQLPPLDALRDAIIALDTKKLSDDVKKGGEWPWHNKKRKKDVRELHDHINQALNDIIFLEISDEAANNHLEKIRLDLVGIEEILENLRIAYEGNKKYGEHVREWTEFSSFNTMIERLSELQMRLGQILESVGEVVKSDPPPTNFETIVKPPIEEPTVTPPPLEYPTLPVPTPQVPTPLRTSSAKREKPPGFTVTRKVIEETVEERRKRLEFEKQRRRLLILGGKAALGAGVVALTGTKVAELLIEQPWRNNGLVQAKERPKPALQATPEEALMPEIEMSTTNWQPKPGVYLQFGAFYDKKYAERYRQATVLPLAIYDTGEVGPKRYRLFLTTKEPINEKNTIESFRKASKIYLYLKQECAAHPYNYYPAISPWAVLLRNNGTVERLQGWGSPIVQNQNAKNANSELKDRPYNELIRQAINRYPGYKNMKLNLEFVHGIIKTETFYNPEDVSYAGAMGLMQLMPKTWFEEHYRKSTKYEHAWTGSTPHPSGHNCDPFNLEQNIDAGVSHLAWLHKEFEGNEGKVAAAYNAGTTGVKEYKMDENNPGVIKYKKDVLMAKNDLLTT